jgi:ankyrin repeat protein
MTKQASAVTPSKLSKLRKSFILAGSNIPIGRPDEDELIRSAMTGDIEKIEHLLSTDHHLRRRPTLLSISGKRVPLDINTTDKMGRTALHWIASQGHENCVDIFMQHLETKSLVPNKDGRTPLHEAAMKGHTNIVEKFLTYGNFFGHKNIDKADNHGRTALHWATLRGHNTISQLLIEEGASVTLLSIDGKSALDLATNANYATIMGLLFPEWAANGGGEGLIRGSLDHEKNLVDPEDKDKRTLLSYASGSGHDNIVNLLIGKRADIEAKDEPYGRTPLSWAAENGHKETVELLVDKGADIEAKDNIGRTPLAWAAENGRKEIVELLADKGADTCIKASDKQG